MNYYINQELSTLKKGYIVVIKYHFYFINFNNFSSINCYELWAYFSLDNQWLI